MKTVTSLCLAYMAILVAIFLTKFIKNDREGRLKYLKGFRIGKFALIYLASIPLFCIGEYYTGASFVESLLDSVKCGVELVALKYNFDVVKALVADDLYFRVVLDICYILVTANALLLVIALIGQRTYNFFKRVSWRLFKRKVYVVIGFNDKNESIIKSIDRKERKVLLVVEKLTDEIRDFAYVERITVTDIGKEKNVGELYSRLFDKTDYKFIAFLRKKIKELWQKHKKNLSTHEEEIYNKKLKKISEKYKDPVMAEKLSKEAENDYESRIREIKFLCKKHIDRNEEKYIIFIINTLSDDTNLIYTEQIKNLIMNNKELFDRNLDEEYGIKCYVFGDPSNQSSFYFFVKASKGAIHYVNKYRLIATDFVKNYPLTRFMDDSYLDYDTATLKDDVDINVVMLGFGSTNQRILLTSVSNDRFMTKDGDTLKNKKVDYYVYDKNAAENEKNLNHNFFRYHEIYKELCEKQEEYLPLPEEPANVRFYHFDVNNRTFYNRLRNNLTPEEGRKAINYIIIAYGTDMENLDFAEKIEEKVNEWQINGITKVFVKIRNGSLSKDVIDNDFARESGIITIANERDIVYNLDKIFAEENEVMAKDRHLTYAFENYLKKRKADGQGKGDKEKEEKEENNVLKDANEQWYFKWDQVQRDSNTYAVLSIRTKLNLIGFDIAKKDEKGEDASEEFMKKYQKDDEIVYLDEEFKGKKMVDYGESNFKEGTLRHRLTVLEHDRWNAYEICSGVIPATKEEIMTQDKTYLLKKRKHGNITTFDGLKIFREMKGYDVIKYDYQLLDDAVWLLHKYGYKIVKKK